MELKFRVAARIARPVGEVFEAVADPEQLSGYFTTGGAQGRLETGATVMWSFADFPGTFPMQVIEVATNQRIVLESEVNDAGGTGDGDPAYLTTVTMTFTSLEDGRTLVEIAEEGWPDTPAALTDSYSNCEGWMQMLCSLKAWLEHRINLREGMYK